MNKAIEENRQEIIAKITAELQTIKGVEFLRFFLELTQSFKRKWGV